MNTINQDYQYCLSRIKAMDSISQIYYIDMLLTEFSQKWIQKVDITDMSFQDYLAKLRLEKDKKVKTLS
jgi:hypothetical protein